MNNTVHLMNLEINANDPNMSSEIKIQRITSDEALPIRHIVLWPDKPLAHCILEKDQDGWHFGAFYKQKLVCVASIFLEENHAQLRKFATLVEFQKMGIGSNILKYVMNSAKEAGIEFFWCNARVNAANFYRRLGLKNIGDTFSKSGIEYIKMGCEL